MGLIAPGAAGRGLILKASSLLGSVAAGVSGKVPGSSDLSFLGSSFFSRGTAAVREAVVDCGVVQFIMAVVAGASETIRSGVNTLFSIPLTSVSLGAV